MPRPGSHPQDDQTNQNEEGYQEEGYDTALRNVENAMTAENFNAQDNQKRDSLHSDIQASATIDDEYEI